MIAALYVAAVLGGVGWNYVDSLRVNPYIGRHRLPRMPGRHRRP